MRVLKRLRQSQSVERGGSLGDGPLGVGLGGWGLNVAGPRVETGMETGW